MYQYQLLDVSAKISHTQIAHFVSSFIFIFYFKVFPPEDSGAASKSGLLQSFETHQKESEQP